MTRLRNSRRSPGVSLLELTVVIAIIIIAAAIAVPALLRTQRTADLETARSEVASAVRRLSQRAATTGETQALYAFDLPVGRNVVVMPNRVELPEGTSPGGKISFEGGTGYPIYEGRRAAVAIVVAERGNESEHAAAVVIGQSATLTEYRLNNGRWEELR